MEDVRGWIAVAISVVAAVTAVFAAWRAWVSSKAATAAERRASQPQLEVGLTGERIRAQAAQVRVVSDVDLDGLSVSLAHPEGDPTKGAASALSRQPANTSECGPEGTLELGAIAAGESHTFWVHANAQWNGTEVALRLEPRRGKVTWHAAAAVRPPAPARMSNPAHSTRRLKRT